MSNINYLKNNNASLKSVLMNKAAYLKIPINGIFELTPRCNMNCEMCYVRLSPQEQLLQGIEKTAEQWIDMGKECAKAGMLFLLLTGGEPFLRPDFRQIYSGLKKSGLIISVNTNGTLLTKETVQWLRQDPPSSVNLTLYGADNDTYKKMCGLENGYDKAINAIKMLKEAGINVILNITLTRTNAGDLDKLIEIGKMYNLPTRIASYMFPPVRKNAQNDFSYRFSPSECGNIRFDALKSQLPADKFVKIVSQIKSGNFTVDESEECLRSTGNPISCMAGISSFWITWDGRMTPCGMMNEPASYPFKDGVNKAWDFISQKITEISLPGACKTCSARKVCKACAAIIMAESGGDSTVKPEYLCRTTEQFLRRVNQFKIEDR